MSSLINNLKKTNSENVSTPKVGVVNVEFALNTQDLQIFNKFYMFQMNPKEVFHNTVYSVQLPYITGNFL